MNAKKYNIPRAEQQRLEELKEELTVLLKNICEVTGFTVEDMASSKRTHPLPYARSAFAVIASESLSGVTLGLIGSIINKDHSSISGMLKRVADVREAKAFCEEVKINLKKINEMDDFDAYEFACEIASETLNFMSDSEILELLQCENEREVREYLERFHERT